MDGDQIRNAQVVAIAGAVAPKDVTAAKHALPQGKSIDVDFIVHIHGVVQKGRDVPSSTVTIQPTLDLMTPLVCLEVLRRLKIDLPALRRMVGAIGRRQIDGNLKSTDEHEAIRDVFKAASEAVAKKLQPKKTNSPGRAGAVSTNASFEINPGE